MTRHSLCNATKHRLILIMYIIVFEKSETVENNDVPRFYEELLGFIYIITKLVFCTYVNKTIKSLVLTMFFIYIDNLYILLFF
jgi:hypothetical protein